MAGDEIKTRNNFLVSLNGQIHSAFFPFFDDVYCKYSFVCGPDWVIVSGIEEGISQISKKGRDEEQLFIWNLPLNIVFKSTNPFGWPQLVVSAYGSDVFDNEVVRGYGVCHIPIAPGPCEKEIPMFVPESSSIIQKFTSWLTGRRPEFIDPRILTQGDAREEMAPDVVAEKNGRKTEIYRARQKFQNCPAPRNLKKESERLKTFINWTVSFLDSKKLAEDGFYFTNTEDVVKCVFCNVQIGDWVEGDDPKEHHRRLSSNCPFLNGKDCGNQIHVESEEEEEDNKDEEMISQDVCGSYGLQIRPFSAPERPGKTPIAIESSNLWRDFEELGVSKIKSPVSPHYATYNARIKTFESWPVPEIQSPEKLAEAGFYYTSFRDNVLCFHCGGGLKNWEVDDDPWEEHARWFSKCGFVNVRKGKEFVSQVLSKADRQIAALTGLSNGCESNTKVAQPEENYKKEESAATSTLTSSSSSSSSSSVCSASPSSVEKQNESSESGVANGKELELCRICYARERGIVFLPCGHFVSCTQCAPSLSTCAVCRKPFEATVRAYLS